MDPRGCDAITDGVILFHNLNSPSSAPRMGGAEPSRSKKKVTSLFFIIYLTGWFSL
jgi:hypothetical protein